MPNKGGSVAKSMPKKEVEVYQEEAPRPAQRDRPQAQRVPERQPGRRDRYRPGHADKAESSYTKEFLLSLSDAERDQLFQIDAALKRIEGPGFRRLPDVPERDRQEAAERPALDAALHRVPGKSGIRDGLIGSARSAFRTRARSSSSWPSSRPSARSAGRLLESPGERVLCRGLPRQDRRPKPLRRASAAAGSSTAPAGRTSAPPVSIARPPFDRHRSCARYRGELKDALLLFKYRRFRSLGAALGRFVVESLAEEMVLWDGVDVDRPRPAPRPEAPGAGLRPGAGPRPGNRPPPAAAGRGPGPAQGPERPAPDVARARRAAGQRPGRLRGGPTRTGSGGGWCFSSTTSSRPVRRFGNARPS